MVSYFFNYEEELWRHHPDEATTVDSEAFQVAIWPVQAIHSPCCVMKTIKTRQHKWKWLTFQRFAFMHRQGIIPDPMQWHANALISATQLPSFISKFLRARTWIMFQYWKNYGSKLDGKNCNTVFLVIHSVIGCITMIMNPLKNFFHHYKRIETN